jgi:hypothetical protein
VVQERGVGTIRIVHPVKRPSKDAVIDGGDDHRAELQMIDTQILPDGFERVRHRRLLF